MVIPSRLAVCRFICKQFPVRYYCKDAVKEENLNWFCSRTRTCGELSLKDVGQRVTLCGWLQYSRLDLFLILRDGYGSTQVVINKQLHETATGNLPRESVIRVHGTVINRPHDQANPKMATGDIEVLAEDVKLLNPCLPQLPFLPKTAHKVKESLRLQHRYIDLRSAQLQQNLRLRSKIILEMRKLLCERYGFVDVETPTLFRRTPGGAREFIVPTHKKNKYYCLTQSPQQFKQLLMVGAMDRYFQIARCYRDESSRSDRQPEFTQLDLEMSFVTQEDVMGITEKLIREVWPRKLELPFPVLTYDEAMNRYGTDKPDLRFDMKLEDVTDLVGCNGPFANNTNNGGTNRIKALVVPKSAELFSARNPEELIDLSDPKVRCITIKVLTNKMWNVECETSWKESVNNALKLEEDDVAFLCVGPNDSVCKLLGQTRLGAQKYIEYQGKQEKTCNDEKFLWVVDFPLFEKTDEGKIASSHHPFTAPIAEHEHYLFSDPLKAKGQHYDLVLNGSEVGGGSIRIHNSSVQKHVLENILKEDVKDLQHLLHALQCGCPPHGGIALGLDRLIAIMCGCSSIQDVMAFPKSMDGKDLMADAPVTH